MKAIILAGNEKGKKNDFIMNKALVPIQGRPMIHYVIQALKASEEIQEVYVVGQIEELREVLEEDISGMIPATGSIVDNVSAAMEYLGGTEPLLIATCDIPLLSGAAVKSFIREVTKHQADLYYPVIPQFLCQENYPDVKRTYVALRDGRFTGGNLVVIHPKAMETIDHVARLMVKHRKNPWQMGRLFGIVFLIKLILRQITVEDVERHIQNQFHIQGKAIISPYPEIGNDIDRPEDIARLGKYLLKKNKIY